MDEKPDEPYDQSGMVNREDLTRRITLDEFFSYSMEMVRRGLRGTVCGRPKQTELEERAQPGDEWWEWVMGTEPLMQTGGLALVRDGSIVWACNTWIS